MQGMELIRHRRSVRTFDGRALAAEDAADILAFAGTVENPCGIPIAWKLLSAKADRLSSPVIAGADTFIAGKIKRLPRAEEAFGYAFERVVLHAEAMGIGTTWIAGTMDRPAFERAMALEADEVMPCVSPLGYPADRMSLRETLMRKGVRADSRFGFHEIFFSGDFRTPLTPENAGPFRGALEMVRWAPSAVNKQPWRAVVSGSEVHFYEKHSKGYVDARGWDLQKIDLGIAMCHFAYGMEQAGQTVSWTVSDPGLGIERDVEYVATGKF